MCWSEGASLAMVGLGAAATVITAKRGENKAIPATLAFFTFMEALQAAGYLVIDQCELAPNKTVTFLSYLHIALQPIFINAFAMSLVAKPLSRGMKRFAYGAATLAFVIMMVRLLPLEFAGTCQPGDTLCGDQWCTISGTWHLGWTVPLNDLWTGLFGETFGNYVKFPSYLVAVFIVPLFYGA